MSRSECWPPSRRGVDRYADLAAVDRGRYNPAVQSHMVTAAFLEFSRRKLLEEYWPRLRVSVESLTDEQMWWRPNQASNSAGNLILHLNGNVRQWLLAAF